MGSVFDILVHCSYPQYVIFKARRNIHNEICSISNLALSCLCSLLHVHADSSTAKWKVDYVHNSFGAAKLATNEQVTKLKLKQKQQEGIAEARSGRRSPVSSLALCHFDLHKIQSRKTFPYKQKIIVSSMSFCIL